MATDSFEAKAMGSDLVVRLKTLDELKKGQQKVGTESRMGYINHAGQRPRIS